MQNLVFWTLAVKIAINYECIQLFTGYLLLTIMLFYVYTTVQKFGVSMVFKCF